MQSGDAIVGSGVTSGFHQMFLKGETVEMLVMMELEQRFGQFAVAQTVVQKQGFYDVNKAVLLFQPVNVNAIEFFASLVQILGKGETVDVVKSS